MKKNLNLDGYKITVTDKGFIYDVSKKCHISHYHTTSNTLGCTINRRQYLVKRLVAMAFIPNPDNLKYVLHKDGDFANISADNLYWSDNKKRNVTHVKSFTVIKKDLNGNFIETFPSVKEMPPEYNKTCVRACCTGEQTKHRNYKWEYGEKK